MFFQTFSRTQSGYSLTVMLFGCAFIDPRDLFTGQISNNKITKFMLFSKKLILEVNRVSEKV